MMTLTRTTWQKFCRQWMLQFFALAGIVFLLIFCYMPMVGVILAFNNYKPKTGFLGFFTSPWVGFRWFKELFSDPSFGRIFANTLKLSLLKLLFSFPMPILFSLVLNEMRILKAKKLMQTISYLPHFVSWVVVQGILVSLLSSQSGVLNQILLDLGFIQEKLPFLSLAKYFLPVAVVSDIWKEMGWWSIIFLAAIAGIDMAQYEAAIVDGASRMQRIWHIILPSIKPTIVVVLILSLGGLLGGGLGGSNFEQAYLLGNDINNSASEILQTYTLKVGLSAGRFSYATAVGLMQSVISVFLVIASNAAARKISGEGLF
ncbi:MAG: ABC transporter permease subunit [Clostridiales bacterium]|jgi:putative aldouronate transport system permease protein|nr:ABC transporter permease subunit [Clostridiales bacterium]